jgi:hypothetical protein
MQHYKHKWKGLYLFQLKQKWEGGTRVFGENRKGGVFAKRLGITVLREDQSDNEKKLGQNKVHD